MLNGLALYSIAICVPDPLHLMVWSQQLILCEVTNTALGSVSVVISGVLFPSCAGALVSIPCQAKESYSHLVWKLLSSQPISKLSLYSLNHFCRKSRYCCNTLLSCIWLVSSCLNYKTIILFSQATWIESRLPSAAANPYLVVAAHVAAGIDGINNRIEPPEMHEKSESLSAWAFSHWSWLMPG